MTLQARPTKNVFLKVLWSGVDSTIPSLFLFTDTKKYVFNCGEGLQRLFIEGKLKFGRIEGFFLTSYQWSHMGGLPGFGMTLRDKNNEKRLAERMRGSPKAESKNDEGASESPASTNKDTHLLSKEGINMDEKDSVKESAMVEEKKIKGSPELIKSDSDVASESAAYVNTTKKGIKTDGKDSVKESKMLEEDLKKIKVYSPIGMTGILDATKSFLRFENTGYEIKVFEPPPDNPSDVACFSDEEITLYPITICNDSDTNSAESSNRFGTVRTVDVSPKVNPPVLCYACHLSSLPGKFDAKKAKNLGLKDGPMRGLLAQGENVTLDNGRIVTPQEVVGPEIPGPTFLVIDCPSIPYIESLVRNAQLQKYLSHADGARLVVHLSPEEVCKEKKYTEWTKLFPSFTMHLYLNGGLQETVAYSSQHHLQTMLNYIDSELFPLMAEHRSLNGNICYNGSKLKNFTKIKVRELLGKSSKIFDDRDSKSKVNYPKLLDVVKKALCKDVNNIEVNRKRMHEEELGVIQNKKICTETGSPVLDFKANSSNIFPKVVCLGTGASQPSKYRNVSGTLVLLSVNDAVLLDCGEGTYCELYRHYGDNVNTILSKIKLVFISHMHPDHHLGLITLILKLNILHQISNSVMIMGPNNLCTWLSDYANVSEALRFKFIDFLDAYKGFAVSDNLQIKSVKVDHPGFAHGIVMTYKNNLKITYSGDTKPCEALVTAGINSNLLIHEATLEDEMIEDAEEKSHSTCSQALEVARKMNAEYVLLTHISQRYPKIPIFNDNELSARTAYAFDHMEVTLDSIPKFNDFLPKFNILDELLHSDELEELKNNGDYFTSS